MADTEKRVAAAKALAGNLRSMGMIEEAQIIDDLRRSCVSACGTLKVLHRDNVEMRRKLGLKTFAEAGPANPDSERMRHQMRRHDTGSEPKG